MLSLDVHTLGRVSPVFGTLSTSMMKCFPKIVKGLKTITVFAKRSIIGIWQGSKYVSESTKYVLRTHWNIYDGAFLRK